MDRKAYQARINAQYGSRDLEQKVLAALEAAGIHLDGITVEELTRFDELHLGGRAATLQMARRAGLSPGLRVLDVGSGLGGPARTLAQDFECLVTGLDLTRSFCDVANRLTALAGLADAVLFHHGDATQMPFEAGEFDLVWNQHFAMNIEDKARLYAEQARVLRPGGRLVIHEIVAGSQSPPHYPVPWARQPDISFLVTADEMRGLLTKAGFVIRQWEDISMEAADWYRQMAARRRKAAKPDPLGQHLVFGRDLKSMAANMQRNLKEGRVAVVAGILEKKA